MASHTAVATTSKGVLEVVQLPTPTPDPGEVLIKIQYSALIAFDTYQLDAAYYIPDNGYPHVLGFASAGIVESVGDGVTDLKEGDRVASMNFPAAKNKAFQEYAVVARTTVAKIPDGFPLHIAASMPDNYVTAMYTLFGEANLAMPLSPSFPDQPAPSDADAPVLVYGASASSGQYTVQTFKLAGYNNIFAIASQRNHAMLKELGAAHCFDYRSPDLVKNILAVTGGRKIAYAVDTIAVKTSLKAIAAVSDGNTRAAFLLPFKEGETVANGPDSEMHQETPEWASEILSGLKVFPIATFKFQQDPLARDYFMPKILPHLIESKSIKANPVRLLNKGPLKERVEEGLDLLRNNKLSGEKVVVEFSI